MTNPANTGHNREIVRAGLQSFSPRFHTETLLQRAFLITCGPKTPTAPRTPFALAGRASETDQVAMRGPRRAVACRAHDYHRRP
jgi:hypothetical protein